MEADIQSAGVETASGAGTRQAVGWSFRAARGVAAIEGMIFLSASLMKATDMALFLRQIKAYGIISQDSVVLFTAWGLVAAECALGTALLVFHRPRLFFSLTVGLLLFFLGITGWASLTGVTDDCGCFGRWMKHTPGQEAVENLILLVAAIICLKALGQRQPAHRRSRIWACYAGCLVGLALPAVFGFPISGITGHEAQRVAVGLTPKDMEGLEHIDLNQGMYLVVLMGTDCLHCQELVPELNRWCEDPDFPEIFGLCTNDESGCVAFAETFQPLFPIGRISEDAFWRLLGDASLPRILLVRDGIVTKAWEQTIPDKKAVERAGDHVSQQDGARITQGSYPSHTPAHAVETWHMMSWFRQKPDFQAPSCQTQKSQKAPRQRPHSVRCMHRLQRSLFPKYRGAI